MSVFVTGGSGFVGGPLIRRSPGDRLPLIEVRDSRINEPADVLSGR